jgi:hypothetical protein
MTWIRLRFEILDEKRRIDPPETGFFGDELTVSAVVDSKTCGN